MKVSRIIVGIFDIIAGVMMTWIALIATLLSLTMSPFDFTGVVGIVYGVVFITSGVLYIRKRNELTMHWDRLLTVTMVAALAISFAFAAIYVDLWKECLIALFLGLIPLVSQLRKTAK